jgi:hypothetical protein
LNFLEGVPHTPIQLFADGSFDPETVDKLGTAFEEAWLAVRASNSALAEQPVANFARELLAQHIMTAARYGERDVNRLAAEAVAALIGPSGEAGLETQQHPLSDPHSA